MTENPKPKMLTNFLYRKSNAISMLAPALKYSPRFRLDNCAKSHNIPIKAHGESSN